MRISDWSSDVCSSDLLRRAAEDPDYRWRDTADVALYGEPGTAVPARLARLSLGIHDEIRVDGGQRVALVRDIGGRRLVLTLDITEFEQRGQHLTVLKAGSAPGVLLAAGRLIAGGLGPRVNTPAPVASSHRRDEAGGAKRGG